MKTKELIEKRAAAGDRVKALAAEFKGNGERWNDDAERRAWDAANKVYDDLDAEVKAHEAIEKRACGAALRGHSHRGRPASTVDLAVAGFCRSASGHAVTDEQFDALRSLGGSIGGIEINLDDTEPTVGRNLRFTTGGESRGLNITTATEGPELVPEGFVRRLEQAMKAYGPMLRSSEVMITPTGNDLPWPTSSDTGNVGELLAEATTIGTSVDPTIGAVTLGAHKYSSKLVLVSAELIQDNEVRLASVLADMLGERIGRIMNTHFTTGTGTGQPRGIVTASTVGVTHSLGTNGATITFDSLINLIHSVDPAYRVGGNVGFMMSDTTAASIRRLRDDSGAGAGTGGYLWQPSLVAGQPERLLGYPVYINQDMVGTFTAADKPILFGDLSKYKVRLAGQIRMRRLTERYADTDQEGFIAFMRADGDLIDAGGGAVKHIVVAA